MGTMKNDQIEILAQEKAVSGVKNSRRVLDLLKNEFIIKNYSHRENSRSR